MRNIREWTVGEPVPVNGSDQIGGSAARSVQNADGRSNDLSCPGHSGREHGIADLLGFIKRNGVKNLVWVTADVHYTAGYDVWADVSSTAPAVPQPRDR